MKIDSIFAIIERSLFSVIYAENQTNEFDRLFDNWTDVQYLKDFFIKNQDDLNSKFYGQITIEEAIEKTIEDAEYLEERLLELAENGVNENKENLQTLFKPLYNYVSKPATHQKSKGYGLKSKSWLRVYAIRIAKNTYVITGGAIKLTPTMNEREHLKRELQKLEITKQYLKENEIWDENDFELLELE